MFDLGAKRRRYWRKAGRLAKKKKIEKKIALRFVWLESSFVFAVIGYYCLFGVVTTERLDMRKFVLWGVGASGDAGGGKRSLWGAIAMVALLALVPVSAQAQLYIDVYQSRDNNNQTLWVFSGSSTVPQLWSVRTGVAGNDNFARRDTWEVVSNSGVLFPTNAPTNQRLALSSITGLDAITSRDRWYVANVLTNTTTVTDPTLSITTNSVARTRAITSLFLNDDPGTGATDRDELGIRVSGSAFRYDLGGTSEWSGAGILAKPFSDFYSGDTDGTAFSFNNLGTGGTGGPRFAAGSDGSIVVRFHRGTVIPEPQEYALAFGLFALGFVIVRRHWQKKKQAAVAAAAA